MGMTMTMMPSWLYYLFGALMLCVAAYCTVVLVLAALSRQTAGWDVEVHHLIMGVAMAGMFVTGWSFGPSVIWELLFAALLVWFVMQAGRSVLAYGPHLPHTAVHALMNLAMLLMYWFPMGASQGSTSTPMSPAAAADRVDPGLGFVIAFLLILAAVFTLASERKGCSVYGTHLKLSAATAPSVRVRAPGEVSRYGPMSPVGSLQRRVSTPWLLDTSHVVMCIAMGFMLVLML